MIINWTKITFTRWDTFVLDLELVEDDEVTPINLTWSSVKFSMKKYEKDTDYIFTWSFSIVNALTWEIKLQIDPAITKTWAIQNNYYDIELTDSSWVVSTIIKDIIQVVYDITI